MTHDGWLIVLGIIAFVAFAVFMLRGFFKFKMEDNFFILVLIIFLIFIFIGGV